MVLVEDSGVSAVGLDGRFEAISRYCITMANME